MKTFELQHYQKIKKQQIDFANLIDYNQDKKNNKKRRQDEKGYFNVSFGTFSIYIQ